MPETPERPGRELRTSAFGIDLGRLDPERPQQLRGRDVDLSVPAPAALGRVETGVGGLERDELRAEPLRDRLGVRCQLLQAWRQRRRRTFLDGCFPLGRDDRRARRGGMLAWRAISFEARFGPA